ncbi:MAG: nucleotidyltransferase substrate binding protein [Candidatus Margulisiibacteriota bacterium]
MTKDKLTAVPNKDTRWKQRFQNFEKAFLLLERTLKIKQPSEAEGGGIIQFYEATFELSWKMLKDYLDEQGFTVTSPREAIKQAFQSDIIEDGHIWIEALEDRNLTTHTYDEKTAAKVIKRIRENYFPVINQLYNYMKNIINT